MMTAKVGVQSNVAEDAEVGVEYQDDCEATTIGDRATIRSGVRIYCDVQIGDDFTTGHDALIRENTEIGNQVVVGTNVVIEGSVTIGDSVKLVTGAYVPTRTRLGNHVFIGPHAVLTNDQYPQRQRETYEPAGPTLEDNVTVGANATLLPNVRVGEGAMIGAGSVVTRDIPPWSVAIGVPAETKPLPDELCEPNRPIEE